MTVTAQIETTKVFHWLKNVLEMISVIIFWKKKKELWKLKVKGAAKMFHDFYYIKI